MTIPRYDGVRDTPLASDELLLERAALILGVFAEDAGADSIVVAEERRGSAELAAADIGWLTLIRDACAEAAIPLPGPLLVHDDGVRWVGPGDLAWPRAQRLRTAPAPDHGGSGVP